MKTLNVQTLHRRWTKRLLWFHLCFFAAVILSAQHDDHQHKGGGVSAEEYHASHPGKCLGDTERAAIQKELDENRAKLKAEGKLKSLKSGAAVSLDWPLRVKPELNYNNYYYILGHVDQDPGGGKKDYNCGNRTYNGHDGTDMMTWPFPWYLYDNDYVEIVAAAAGTITGKRDGNFDKRCSWVDGALWNAVYIEHSDGSVAWYGHMKKNSLTSKAVGDTVEKGEYLGLVASSGRSSDPHLHFEVHDSDGSIIDPYSGSTCNSLNADSWWASEQDYWTPTINALLTHSALPDRTCTGEDPRLSNQFAPGETVYVAVYFRDYLVNDKSYFKMRRPDGSIWHQWEHVSVEDENWDRYWFPWNFDIPANEQQGMWTVEVEFEGQYHSHQFYYGTGEPPVIEECPEDLITSNYQYNTDIQAANTIDCSAVIANNDDVKCHAGTLVTLSNGFHAEAGSTFHAYIQGCDTNQDDCEILSNSNFDLDSGDWTIHGGATTAYNGNTVNIDITTPGADSWNVILRQVNITLEANKTYNFSMRAKADTDRSALFKVFVPEPSYYTYIEKTINLTTEMDDFDFSFTMPGTGTTAAFMELLLGGNANDVEVDFISITEQGCAPPPPTTCELLTNRNFDNDLSDWQGWGCTQSADNGIATFTGISVGANPWDITFRQIDLSIQANKTYTLIFKARASENRTIGVRAIENGGDFHQYFSETFNLTTSTQTHTTVFESGSTALSNVRLDFMLAADNANVYIDEVSLTTPCNNKEEVSLAPDIQLYPNPATNTINVKYELPQSTSANIAVFDAFGKLVKNTSDVELLAGEQTLNMDVSDLAAGMYFYTLQASEWKATKKFIIVK